MEGKRWGEVERRKWREVWGKRVRRGVEKVSMGESRRRGDEAKEGLPKGRGV